MTTERPFTNVKATLYVQHIKMVIKTIGTIQHN